MSVTEVRSSSAKQPFAGRAQRGKATAQRVRPPTRRGGRLASIVWAAALAIVASTAQGAADDPMHKFRELSPGLHWSGNTMSWYYAPSGQPSWASAPQVVTLIQQAMNAWS